MNVEVYADILFLNNVTGNLLVLVSASILMRQTIRKARMLFAAGFGALYSTVLFFTELSIIPVMVFNIIFILTVIRIAFNTSSLKEYGKNAAYFFAANFIVGGCFYGLYRFTGVSKITALSNGMVYFHLPVIASVVLLALAVLLVMLLSKLNGEVRVNSLYMHVSVHLGDMTIPLNGFFDTGNRMTDFLTGLPVFVAEAEFFRPFFPETTYQKIISGDIEKMTGEELKKVRLLPANTAFANSNLLVCIRPDYIQVRDKNKTVKIEALIGLTGKKLSLTGEYNMLLSPAIQI